MARQKLDLINIHLHHNAISPYIDRYLMDKRPFPFPLPPPAIKRIDWSFPTRIDNTGSV